MLQKPENLHHETLRKIYENPFSVGSFLLSFLLVTWMVFCLCQKVIYYRRKNPFSWHGNMVYLWHNTDVFTKVKKYVCKLGFIYVKHGFL